LGGGCAKQSYDCWFRRSASEPCIGRSAASDRIFDGYGHLGIVKALAAERPGERTDAERRHELKRWLTISKCAIEMPFVSLIFPPPKSIIIRKNFYDHKIQLDQAAICSISMIRTTLSRSVCFFINSRNPGRIRSASGFVFNASV
jgi:hypothetical protein